MEWKQLKRKYPMYFWPQILLNEIVKSATHKEKKRLDSVIRQLKDKSRLSKELEKILRQDFNNSQILQ